MDKKFDAFLSRLETKDNKPIIETIRKGFKAVTEGYGDLREAPVQAIDTFNYHAAMTAASLGNNVLNFLNHSEEQRKGMFTVDEEPELDGNFTSPFNQYVEEIPEHDEIAEDLGFSAAEL